MNGYAITYGDLAELYDAIGKPDVAKRMRADHEADIEADRGDALSAIESTLDEVPEPSKKLKHNDRCWTLHAPCLANLIRGDLP
jgi:hypothetical protein